MSAPMTRREFTRLLAAGSLGAAVSPGLYAAEKPPAKKPHILLLMDDQHRGDCLSCAGNNVVKTPNLDRLAKDGAYFRHGYSSTPSCTPARTALLTGQSPWHHGMLGYGQIAHQYPFEMVSALRESGYYCACFGKTHYQSGDMHGFHEIDSNYGKWFAEHAPGLDPRATGLGSNDHRGKMYALPEELHSIHWTSEIALDFIRKYDRPDPLFLKVSFLYPHSPYDAPKRFWDMYDPKDIPTPQVGDWAAKYAPIDQPMRDDLWHGKIEPDVVRQARQAYYGNITFIDEEIGRLLKALEDKGMLDDTLIIFIADHGDMTGDQNLWRKTYAYEPSARIPFILRWPKSMGQERRRGITLDQPVEIRDVLPTFLTAAGHDVPKSVDGKDLMRLVRGETRGWREYLDLEHAACYAGSDSWIALTDGRWKYILDIFTGDEQLFHVDADPHELKDLAPEESRSRELKRWRDRMMKHLAERGPDWVKDGKPVLQKQRVLYGPSFPKG